MEALVYVEKKFMNVLEIVIMLQKRRDREWTDSMMGRDGEGIGTDGLEMVDRLETSWHSSG